MVWLVNFLSGNAGNGLSMSSPEVSLSGNLAQIMGMVDKIGKVILTCIYIVLGVFLVIKGALLGMQIVKAADEPQVRQEKIGSLKWLVIGVAIAYLVAIAADVAIGIIKDAVK